jgi:hypothetical protein
MILYILLSIAIIYLLIFAFIKLRFRFWSVQPVFHLYNLFYWIWPCGIIEHGQPPKTKFYNGKVLTKKFKDVSTEKKALFYTFIKSHFLNNKKEKYNPPKFAVLDYFNAHNRISHLSLQFELLPTPNKGYLSDNTATKIVSAMTTRPLNAILNNNEVKVDYVDFLCVHKDDRKKGLAQKIIYSHYYNARKDGAGPVFLFKREGIINFIVPLTVYNAHVFPLKYLKHPNLELPNNIVCHLINDSNFSLFSHFFGEIKKNFKCCITPEQSHIKHLVSKKLLFICLIMEGQMPVGVYIYRTPFTSYKGKQSIECIASYYKMGYYDIFIKSFRNTMVLINHEYPVDILIMENISNNNDIINHLLKITPVLWKCPMAYFLYNFAYRPFFSSDVFLIN